MVNTLQPHAHRLIIQCIWFRCCDGTAVNGNCFAIYLFIQSGLSLQTEYKWKFLNRYDEFIITTCLEALSIPSNYAFYARCIDRSQRLNVSCRLCLAVLTINTKGNWTCFEEINNW